MSNQRAFYSLYRSRTGKILLGVLIFLIAFRLVLPVICKHYINHVLKDHIEGYTGRIEDFDLSLLRGAYQMEGFVLQKIENKVRVPFMEAKDINFSIAWKPLLKGHVVGEITLDTFKVNFVNGPSEAQQQTGVEGKGWVDTIDKLFPLEIEELKITNSEIHFRDFSKKPEIDLYLKNVEATANNLTNTAGHTEALISKYTLDATIQNKGKLKITGAFNLLEKPQPFDLNLSGTAIDLAEFNNFFDSYANFDVGHGRLDVFAEVASSDGKVKGYVKPMLTRTNIIKARNKEDDPATGTDVLASVINLFVRRYSKDQSAAKIPFEGSLEDPKVKTWPAIKSLFKHAFGDAIPARIDKEIDIKDVRKHDQNHGR